jgi:hypothetical protein
MKEIELRYTRPQLDIFFSDEQARHVLVQKGRRFGATKGAANACIEWLIEGQHILWGDTIHSNINKYFERYFLPELKANKIEFNWAKQERTLTAGKGHIDFRSADNPENWEGFGYSRIILNEAGIILSNPYLYTNAVRPMMLDHPDAVLYALGVPKGKLLKDGKEHPFYTLCKKKGEKGYRVLQYSSYDNPLLSPDDIRELELDMSAMDSTQVEQEIYGNFIDRVGGNPFAIQYDKDRHSLGCHFQPNRTLYVSFDFNLDPFAIIFSHIWEDKEGLHYHIFDEMSIQGGTLANGVKDILAKYGQHRHMMVITGDYNGTARQMAAPDGLSHYLTLKRMIGLTDRQFDIRPNPRHSNSRSDCNFILANAEDFRVSPNCVHLERDLRTVEVDSDEKIIKVNRSKVEQRADHLDAFRYLCNTKALQDWAKRKQMIR